MRSLSILIFFLFLTQSIFASNLIFIEKVSSCSDKIQDGIDLIKKIPKKLIVAQAIMESNWGRSRFAKEGNNYFGMRTWDLTKPHMKPKLKKESTFGLVIYPNMCASVEDYIYNLNVSGKYSELRKARMIEVKLWNSVDPIVLAKYLGSYSEEGPTYVKKIINQIRNLNKY